MTGSASGLFSVEGKRALVTGGSSGIGKMIAAGLAGAGAAVSISSRKADELSAVASEIEGAVPVTAIPADLSTSAGVDSLATEIVTRFGSVDILVNNAAATWGAPLVDYPDSSFDKV